MSDFKASQDALQASLVSTVKSVNRIAAQDLSFQRTINPDVDERLDATTSRILGLANRLLRAAPTLGHRSSSSSSSAPRLEDVEDVDLHWQRIVDSLDASFERTDVALDEYTGVIRRKTPPPGESDSVPAAKKPKSASALHMGERFAQVPKPQLIFDVQPNNFPDAPWKPILTRKPHAILPLEQSLTIEETEDTSDGPSTTKYSPPENTSHNPLHSAPLLKAPPRSPHAPGSPAEEENETLPTPSRRAANKKIRKITKLIMRRLRRYTHPYETEISQMEYPERVFQPPAAEPTKPDAITPGDNLAIEWVDTYEGVLEMLAELKKATEIAVDLEHHDYRTYGGLTCLMQISTRDKDWIIDTLGPWRNQLEVLNEVFADPKIVKVLHGSYMDVMWLQRDLGLYLVGHFDTFFAADLLGYPQRSLAYLLKKFVDFDADKKYQLADWRIRPIPEEMLYYARSDTHFLLYIYDKIRTELLSKTDRSDPETDLIGKALQRSREQALSRYNHPTFDERTGGGSRGWYNALVRQPTPLTGEKFAVLRAVWKWRDDAARRADESTGYVLPQAAVWDVAKVLPPDMKALHSLLPRHAYLARQEIDALWAAIQKARAEGGPSVHQFLTGGHTLGGSGMMSGDAEDAAVDVDGVEGKEIPALVKSQLFGGVPMSTRWEEGGEGPAKDGGEIISLPWQRLYAEQGIQLAVREPEVQPQAAKELKQAVPESAPVEDTEFTLKEGRKRKRAAEEAQRSASASSAPQAAESEEADEETGEAMDMSTEPNSSAPDASAPEGDDAIAKERARQKKLKRKARQQLKKAKRASTGSAVDAKEDDQDQDEEKEKTEEAEQAFDYSKAESVMHGRESEKAQAGFQVRKAKVFDPYLKSADVGVKGARKAPPIHGGRSATFKK